MNKIRKHPFLLTASIVSLILGLLLILSDHNEVINFIYFAIGGGLIITGISKIALDTAL